MGRYVEQSKELKPKCQTSRGQELQVHLFCLTQEPHNLFKKPLDLHGPTLHSALLKQEAPGRW